MSSPFPIEMTIAKNIPIANEVLPSVCSNLKTAYSSPIWPMKTAIRPQKMP